MTYKIELEGDDVLTIISLLENTGSASLATLVASR